MSEIKLYQSSGAAGQPARLIAPEAITATMSSSTGQVSGTGACVDGNLATSCTSGADEDPSLTISFNCTETGSALSSLSSVVVYTANGTNASDFELVLRNRAGQVEQILNFTTVQQGQQVYNFSLNSSVSGGACACAQTGRYACVNL